MATKEEIKKAKEAIKKTDEAIKADLKLSKSLQEFLEEDTSPEAWVDDSQWDDNTVLSDAEIDAEIFAGQVMKMLKKAA